MSNEEERTVTDRHYYEDLSDNTHVHYCETCEDCMMWGIGNDPFSNAHDKTNCAMFPTPGYKPIYVINNTGPCPAKVPRE